MICAQFRFVVPCRLLPGGSRRRQRDPNGTSLDRAAPTEAVEWDGMGRGWRRFSDRPTDRLRWLYRAEGTHVDEGGWRYT